MECHCVETNTLKANQVLWPRIVFTDGFDLIYLVTIPYFTDCIIKIKLVFSLGFNK